MNKLTLGALTSKSLQFDPVQVTWCARAQIQFWWKIKPQEAIKDKFGVPIPTSGRMNRAPMRIVLALDVSHSMSEPFGEDEGFLESEVLFRCLSVSNEFTRFQLYS